MSKSSCPRCRAEIESTSDRCPVCGHALAFARVRRIEAAVEGRLKSCPDCGGTMSVRALACPDCGALNSVDNLARAWRRIDSGFEWRSRAEIFGYPLIHVAIGRKDGRRRVARGVIAIGQFGIGLITIAQFGVGLLFGFGQFMLGTTAVAQVAITLLFGAGQAATGYVAIGQLALGYYALAQIGFGVHLWTSTVRDPAAVELFGALVQRLGFGAGK